MYHESEKIARENKGITRRKRPYGRKWGGLFEVFPNGSDSVTVDLSVGGGAALYIHTWMFR
jgi:hypothetical protein